jgi:hypothetical protein
MGKGNIEWILPDADTTGVRDDAPIEWDPETGRPKEKRRLVPDAPKKDEAPQDRAAETPQWGLF